MGKMGQDLHLENEVTTFLPCTKNSLSICCSLIH